MESAPSWALRQDSAASAVQKAQLIPGQIASVEVHSIKPLTSLQVKKRVISSSCENLIPAVRQLCFRKSLRLLTIRFTGRGQEHSWSDIA